MDDLSASASTQSFNSFPNVAESALIDDAMYRAMYEASIRDPRRFGASTANVSTGSGRTRASGTAPSPIPMSRSKALSQ
jgi:hypothetical protein